MAWTGQETVDAAGTAQPITTTAQYCIEIVIKALNGNAGLVYIGDSTVDSATGLELAAGELTVKRDISGRLAIHSIYVDAAANDYGVSWQVIE